MNYFSILAQTVPVFLVMGVGLVCQRLGLIDDQLEKGIMRLVLNVLYPCFILWKVPGNPALQSSGVVFAAIGVGFGLTLAGFGICYVAGKLLGLNPKTGLATFAVAVGLQNYGFIPIPLIEGIFPKEVADPLLGVLFVHNLGLETALWTCGVMLISGSSEGAWKKLINGPVIAILLGLTLNFTGLYQVLPEVGNSVLKKIGVCAIPVSLMLVGASLGAVISAEGFKPDWRLMSAGCLLRMGLLAAIFMIVALVLSPMPNLQRVVLIQAAMPTAVFPVVVAKFFGGKPSVAVNTVLATSLASVAMTPAILTLGFWLFGVEFL